MKYMYCSVEKVYLRTENSGGTPPDHRPQTTPGSDVLVQYVYSTSILRYEYSSPYKYRVLPILLQHTTVAPNTVFSTEYEYSYRYIYSVRVPKYSRVVEYRYGSDARIQYTVLG